jgi:aminoglycoside phosphotransferase (APT) family kinase protein
MTVRADAPDLRAVREVVQRIFPGGASVSVERMLRGGSTFVYRLRRGVETFYLRVLPEIGDSFAPEALAHRLLRERGVLAPDVLYVEHLDATLGLSVMVTAEIPGEPLSDRPVDAHTREIVVTAGRQLALVNAEPVAGFGWIRREREPVSHLTADHATFRAWMLEQLDADLLALERAQLLGGADANKVRRLVAQPGAWGDGPAVLAHGDFDVTHIFQDDGRYTGVIDFGEIRSADRWYDVGYFHMYDGELGDAPLLPWLLDGYASVAPLPPDHRERIARASVLIAVRAWARRLERSADGAMHHLARRTIPRDLRALSD